MDMVFTWGGFWVFRKSERDLIQWPHKCGLEERRILYFK